MTNVLNKSVSLLLSAIMVLCLLAMPVMPAIEAQADEADLMPAALSYIWDYDDASLITSRVVQTNYGYKDGKFLAYYGTSPSANSNNFISGVPFADSNNFYDGNGFKSTFELVSDGNGGQFARIANPAGQIPTYRVELPEAITGNVSIEFDLRISKIDAQGNAVPFADTDTTTRYNIFKVNNGKPIISYTPRNQQWVLNHTWANPAQSETGITCSDETHTDYNSGANVINANPNTAEFAKVKMTINTEENYATFDNFTCGEGHLLKVPAACADGITSFQFQFTGANMALGEGEYIALDVDNIKLSQIYDTVPTPAANIANNAKAVSVNQSFEVDFGMDITEDEKAAVKLLKDGAEVPAGKTIVGTKVMLDPTDSLLPGTQYTLNVAPLARSNGTTAEQNISFYTAKDYTFAFMDFEGIDTTNVEGKTWENALRSEMDKGLKTSGTYSEGASQNDIDYVKIQDGKLLFKNAHDTTATGSSYSQYIFYQKQYGYERTHIEFDLTLDALGNTGYPTVFAIVSTATSGNTIASLRYNGALKFCASGLGMTNELNTGINLLTATEIKGTYKFVWDVDVPAGTASVKVYNSDGTLKKEASYSKGSAITAPVRGSYFRCYTSATATAGTVEKDGVTYNVNNMAVDNYRIEYRPTPGAAFTTPTANLPTDATPVIEFKTPVADASAMKLYKVVDDEEILVEDAEFNLSADGYTCEINATLEGETEYRVKHTDLVDVNGETVPETLGFLTAPKMPSVTVEAGLYAKADTAFATPLSALTEDADVVAKVDFTNNEAFAAHGAVIYAAVYDAEGNLLLASAVEENILAGATKAFTLGFKVPAGAASLRVFAWDKWLTPYCNSITVIE